MFNLIKINILFIFSLFTSACSVFGIRTVEELEYTVISRAKYIEIRAYKPYIAAVASKKGSYEEAQGELFRVLAKYIFGKNSTDSKIAMTAPVKVNSKKISMTAPVVLSSNKTGEWEMAFSMPSKYTLESLPKPIDKDISLVKVPSKLFAVIRFSGSFNNLKKRQEKSKDLIKWINSQNKYKQVSDPVYAGYDPPFTLPFLRRNEVFIEIKK